MIGFFSPLILLASAENEAQNSEAVMTHDTMAVVSPFVSDAELKEAARLSWHCSMQSKGAEGFDISGTIGEVVFLPGERRRTHRKGTFKSSGPYNLDASGTVGWKTTLRPHSNYWFVIEMPEKRYKIELEYIFPGKQGFAVLREMDVKESRYDYSWNFAGVGLCNTKLLDSEDRK